MSITIRFGKDDAVPVRNLDGTFGYGLPPVIPSQKPSIDLEPENEDEDED